MTSARSPRSVLLSWLLPTVALLGGCAEGQGTFTEFDVPAGSPGAIVVGPDGNLWFTEHGGLGRLSPAGQLLEIPLPSGTPRSVAAGPDGNVWFTETSDPTLSGAVPPGNKIGRLNLADQTVSEFARAASEPGSDTFDIVTGPDGNLWFTDELAGKFGRVTPAGDITELAVKNAYPEGIVRGPDGNLWYAQLGAVGSLTPGGVATSFSVAAGDDLAVGADGNLWFSQLSTHAIGRITPSGDVKSFPLPDNMLALGMTPGSGDIWFAAAFGVAVDRPDRIGRITTSGNVSYHEIPTPHAAPMDVARTADGNVWFTENGANKIGKLTP